MDKDYDVKCKSGATRKQSELLAAFNLVANKDHWKNPITTTLLQREVDEKLLTDAIIHFTGSVPTFSSMAGGRVLIKANGYYLTIGA